MELTGTIVDLIVAFGAGVSAFFASCFIPLVPAYITYLTGVSSLEKKKSTHTQLLLRHSFAFVLGFTIAFFSIVLALRSLSELLQPAMDILPRLVGFILVVLGLRHAGLLPMNMTAFNQTFEPIKIPLHTRSLLRSTLVGVGFGFTWTPCIGPVLALILLWTSQVTMQSYGLVLLLAFSLGIGIPFIGVALGWDAVLPLLKRSTRFSKYLTIITSVLLIITGILLLTDTLSRYAGVISHFL